MGSIRAQAQFERSQWRLRLLLPLWFLQLSLALTVAGLFAWRLGDSVKQSKARKDADEVSDLELVWESTNVALATVSALCTVFEVAKFISESLTPWTVLFTHTIKLACAAGLLAVDIAAHVQKVDSHYSAVSLALDAALLATAGALAVYAVITYRRLEATGYSDQIRLVQGYGFNDEQQYRDSGSGSLTRGVTLEKRRSSVSSRRLSLTLGNNGGRSRSGSTSDIGVGAVGAEEMGDLSLNPVRRSSSYYNHERDTQFDEYVAARRRSNSLGRTPSMGRPPSMDTKGDVERAMAFEFGWGTSPPVITTTAPPTGEKSGGNHGVSEQDGMVLTGGVVNGRVTAASMTRLSSVSSGHVLVSVPEEDDDEHHGRGRDAKDRQALLENIELRDSDESGPRVMQEVDLVEPRWQRQ